MFCKEFYIEHVHKFFDDDVIIVTSSVHRAQSTCVFCSPPVIYHNLQLTNSIGMIKTNKLNKLMSPLYMLKISVLFLNISSEFIQTFVPSINKLLNA